MNTLEKLKSEIEICDLHAARLRIALKHIKPIFPLTPVKLEKLSDQKLAFFDVMSGRFAQLQDTIGNKVFFHILQALKEFKERDSFVDRLNKLEKLEIIKDVKFWNHMREVRNDIAHEYPGADQMISKIKNCFESSFALLSFWEELKQIMAQRIPLEDIKESF